MNDDIKNMSPAEFLDNVRLRMVNAAAMGAAYASWSDEFSRSEVRNAWADAGYTVYGRKLSIAEIRSIPVDKLRDLGFNRWDETLTLIPLWAWNYVQDGGTLTSISGDTAIKGSVEIDLDVRAGCIAYGFSD